MPFAAAIGLVLFAVGALMSATDWIFAGIDRETIGAILMIAGGSVLLALVLLSASPNGSVEDGGLESSAPFDEPDERAGSGRPRG